MEEHEDQRPNLRPRLNKALRRIEWMRDIGTLAGIIRLVDGNHSLGAGALAEAIVSQWDLLATADLKPEPTE